MDSNYKIYKDGIGKLFLIDSLGNKKEVSAADLQSSIQASNLKPGEHINVKSNLYSSLKSNSFSSVDLSSCTYNFNIKK